MPIGDPVLRAHLVRTVGHGQRYLVELALSADGRIHKRLNAGVPETVEAWKEVGRWSDLESERRRLLAEGWKIES